ncbi:hypothetical protein PATA110616_12800 [Paenibacillus tarimensis]
MGLDIILIDLMNRVGLVEIPSSLHEAIFKGTSNWSSYMYSSEIKD